MPKTTRAAEEVIGIKDRILETALQHLIEDGFEHFSMRKLAARLGMTAANIYNYFTNKDELYLLIQTRGFEMLYDFLHKAYKRSAAPEKKLENMIRAYLKFGMDNPEYYEIMFSRNTPKYADYKGTAMEKVALLEKQTALKSADITIQALSDLFANNKTVHIDTLRFRMLQIWFTLNGMINLFNSRVLQEVEDHVDAIIKRMTRDIMKTIKSEGMDKSMKITAMNLVTGSLLRVMAFMFNTRPSLRRYLRNSEGWINFTVGFSTAVNTVEQSITFKDGHARVSSSIPPDADVTLRFVSDQTLIHMLGITPNEVLTLILNNEMILDGNLAYLQLFNFYIALLLGKKHQRMLDRRQASDVKARKKQYVVKDHGLAQELRDRSRYRMKADRTDPGVKYLVDPYLSEYSLDDFPRLKTFLDRHFTIMPEICAERPKLLTDWYRQNGFECDNQGRPWVPELRQAYAFKYLMENKKPIIANGDIIAGTTTAKEPTGVVIYPDSQGTMIWGELSSVDKRILNPYRVSQRRCGNPA